VESGVGPAAIVRTGAEYAVRTSRAGYRARRIVIAAGMHSGELAGMLGAELGIEAFPIQVSVTEPATDLIRHLVYCAGEKLTMKQTRVGSILIGGGWPARLDPSGRPVVDIASLAANLRVACEVVPAIGGLSLVRSWAAYVNGTADWLPIIGELPGAPGVFINYVPWMGFTGGPAAARGVADLLQGRAPVMDVPFSAFAP
jgi:glycine/D-amino acid oxidase-like deaminating enzyme